MEQEGENPDRFSQSAKSLSIQLFEGADSQELFQARGLLVLLLNEWFADISTDTSSPTDIAEGYQLLLEYLTDSLLHFTEIPTRLAHLEAELLRRRIASFSMKCYLIERRLIAGESCNDEQRMLERHAGHLLEEANLLSIPHLAAHLREMVRETVAGHVLTFGLLGLSL